MIADRVFKNAKVYSVSLDGTETRAEAVAVKDGKFVFVGSNADAQNYIGEGTSVTDCNGGSILPGFGDAHMHFGISVRRFGVIDLNELITDLKTQTPDDIVKIMQDRIKEFADSHPNNKVLRGSGWDRIWFGGTLQGLTRKLTRHDIDAVVSDRPVVLDSACGHACLLNTKALEVAGITKDSGDIGNGVIRREADGTPDGFILEPSTIVAVCSRIPDFEFSSEQNKESLLISQDFFAKRGFTYLCDFLRNDASYQDIKELAESGQLKLRIDGAVNFNDATREQDLQKAISEKGKMDVDDLFKVDTAKYFIDEDFSMMEPFEDSYCDENGLPHGYGTTDALLWNLDNFKKSMEDVKKAGYNIHVHAYGDRATKETVDSMINSQKYDKEGKLRDAIAHIFFIREEDKERMADAGIIASIQPQWENVTTVDGATTIDIVGNERFKRLYPNGSLSRAGIRCAYGSDFTVTVPNALEGISIAMTRKYTKSSIYYDDLKDVEGTDPTEVTTLKDAIMGWTIHPAYQFGREDLTGSIEVGKSAEMVVLDGDIENTPAEDICLMKIIETVFKGNTTFKA